MRNKRKKEFENLVRPSVNMDMLRQELPSFEAQHLIEILTARLETDLILRKCLFAVLAIRKSNKNFKFVSDTLDYALHFDSRGFIDDHLGHEMILEEILKELEKTDLQFAIQIAEYVIERAGEVLELFEEGHCWDNGIEQIADWLEGRRVVP